MTYAKDGILDQDPKEVLIQSAFAHDCKGSEIFIDALQIADVAWALTLHKVGVLKDFDSLMQALLDLKNFQLNPKYGDIYNSKNVALKQLSNATKDLHISRPRREAINVAFYLKLKDELVQFSLTLKNLAKTFLTLAIKYKNTLMSDLTYLQHAQPTTFGHYVLTFLHPLLRDFERVELLYKHLNVSVAGSGSVNGCSFAIDQEYLAKLLDFDGVELHARDAMWRSDLPIELLYVLNSIMANMKRFVDELQIFATAEFGMVQLPSSLSRASVIMPNKQNPYALSYIRGVANELLGKMGSFIAYENGVSGNPDSRTFVYVDSIEMLQKTQGALELFSVVLKDLQLNEKLLASRVKESFFYATDIADWLTLNTELTYEEAHSEVGRVIRFMKEQNLTPSQIQEEFFNYPLPLSELTDPYKSIERKKTQGSVGDLNNIIKNADKKIEAFYLQMGDFSYLEGVLKEYGYAAKFTT